MTSTAYNALRALLRGGARPEDIRITHVEVSLHGGEPQMDRLTETEVSYPGYARQRRAFFPGVRMLFPRAEGATATPPLVRYLVVVFLSDDVPMSGSVVEVDPSSPDEIGWVTIAQSPTMEVRGDADDV